MKLSECKFIQVNMSSIRCSLDLMSAFLHEKCSFLVIEPDPDCLSRTRTVTDFKEQRELIRKFRRANPQKLSAEDLEFYIDQCWMKESSEPIRNLAVVVSHTVGDKRDFCGSLTMTELRRGYWGWTNRSLYS